MAGMTIKDLARILGVAPSTVSRAMHGHSDVSEATRKRVLEAAEKYSYQPSLIAQSLQKKRSNTIGVIVPEIRHHFFSTVISGIEEIAYQAGYICMVCQSNETLEREIANTRALVANRVAGLLIAISTETLNHEHIINAMQMGVPVVQFDRVVEELETSKVVIDDRKAAYGATVHLIERGFRRIGHFAGEPGIALNRHRYEGYRQALSDHGLDFEDRFCIPGGYREDDGRRSADSLLELGELPDAVLAINDPVAVGAVLRLREKGVRIPEDLAMVGFSDTPAAAYITPPLTTVFQPSFDMGKTAASLLLEQFQVEKEHFVPRTVTLQTELRIRESSVNPGKR